MKNAQPVYHPPRPLDLEPGRLITALGSLDLPISVEECWSAFDDYLTIQQAFAFHGETKLVLGGGRPKNGVGAEVVFEFQGQETRETLWQKDDQNMIWVMGIPQSNFLFDYYRFSFHAYQGPEGPKGQIILDTIATEKCREFEKARGIDYDTLVLRILQVCMVVLDRDGLRSNFVFELDCSVESFWKVISDWSNISWVTDAKSVEALEPKFTKQNRQLTMEDGTHIKEVLYDVDETTHTLTYYVWESSAWPVSMYRGTMKLLPGSKAGKTKVSYSNVFLAKEGVDAQKFRAALEQTFTEKNIPTMQKRFKH